MISESKFFLTCRVIVAKKLNIPPDDLDIDSIVECVKRAIKKKCESASDELVLHPETKDEEKAVLSLPGIEVVTMMEAGEHPFYDWFQKFEYQYVEEIMRKKEGR